MNKEIKQLPKEIDKIIDSYFPYKKLISIPPDDFLVHYLNFMGVYILYSAKTILYIGNSGNIGRRLERHFYNGNYRNEITDIDIIRFTAQYNSMGIEAKLIEQFKPLYNKTNHYLRSSYPSSLEFDFYEIKEKIKKRLGIK